MSELKFCQFCGSEVSPGDSYCSSCGQMISGSRALTGPAEFNFEFTLKNMVLALLGLFIALNIATIVFLILFPPTGLEGTWFFAVPPLIILIVAISVLNIEFNEGGMRKWIGKQLNPYKPMNRGERLGMLIGGFFTLIGLAIVLYIFSNPDIPLFTRRDFLVALVLFVPIILDFGLLIVKFAIGNAPELEPVLAIRNVILIIVCLFFIIFWFLDIPAMVLWIESIIGTSIFSNWVPLTLIEDFVKFIFWVGVLANIIGFIWHLIMFTAWLDVKHGVLGGRIATIVAQEQ